MTPGSRHGRSATSSSTPPRRRTYAVHSPALTGVLPGRSPGGWSAWTSPRRALGDYGERLACRYLLAQGLTILDRNWRCVRGEIDVVAVDGRELVVCEVKTRTTEAYGAPFEAVTRSKQRRLRRLAGLWRDDHADLARGLALRIDVISILRPPSGRAAPRAPTGGVLMGLGRTRSVGLRGVHGFVVDVEAHVTPGLPGFAISGLGDSAVKQSSDRIKAAAALIEKMPVSQRRVTVNLSPAGERKVGTGFDLGIFIAVAAAMDLVPVGVVRDVVHIGEVGLDGTVRPVPGVLPLVRAAVPRGGATRRGPGRQRGRGPPRVRRAGAPGGRRHGARPALRRPREGTWRGGGAGAPGRPAATGAGARPERGRRPGRRQARARDLGCRRSPPAARGSAGRRQDDAGRAAARTAAGAR